MKLPDRKMAIKINEKNIHAVKFVCSHENSGLCQLALLINEGLQPDNFLFEIGCGALSGSIPIIRFLNKNRYWGVDPNVWLRDDTLEIEENRDILEKNPIFYSNSDFMPELEPDKKIKFDFIFAHSIFNHAANWQWESFIKNIKKYMKKETIMLLSVLFSEGNRFGNKGSNKTVWNEWQAQKVIIVNGKPRGDRKGAVAWKSKNFFRQTCETENLNMEIMENYTDFYSKHIERQHHDWIRVTKK